MAERPVVLSRSDRRSAMLLANKGVDWLLVVGVASVFSSLGLMTVAVVLGF